MIYRLLENLDAHLKPGKVLVIYGPRQVGKTTLIKNFLSQSPQRRVRFDTGDDIRVRDVLSSSDKQRILDYAAGLELVAVDEAQQIPDIGRGLKILVDSRPDIFVIATGSSSFELASEIGEPLTGRKKIITLYPISQLELLHDSTPFELKGLLPSMLVFGTYPAVLTAKSPQEKREILSEIANSYLYRDILALAGIRNEKTLHHIVKLLAFQIGSEVSLHEISRSVGVDVKTVQRYLDLLEKSFVILPLSAFSRNLRKEVTRNKKYYFYDTGVRNAVIDQLQPLENRNDIGHLWENFIFVERLKARAYKNIPGQPYFWRTYDQKEIDLVEEADGKVSAFEVKWKPGKKSGALKTWHEHYPEAKLATIEPENYLSFL